MISTKYPRKRERARTDRRLETSSVHLYKLRDQFHESKEDSIDYRFTNQDNVLIDESTHNYSLCLLGEDRETYFQKGIISPGNRVIKELNDLTNFSTSELKKPQLVLSATEMTPEEYNQFMSDTQKKSEKYIRLRNKYLEKIKEAMRRRDLCNKQITIENQRALEKLISQQE